MDLRAVNILQEDGYSALMLAVSRNYLPLVRELLKSGANINKKILTGAGTPGRPPIEAVRASRFLLAC
eukprot:SAG11_NODE_32099_length_286_cov_1.064171_1_plen_67_part_10